MELTVYLKGWVNEMGELLVYNSVGDAIHPKTASSNQAMATYFDSRVCAIRTNPTNPTIEIYAMVRTENRPEQVGIKYIGDDRDTLFDDFRQAIKRDLIENRGWSIPEKHSGPESLFYSLVWNRYNNSNTSTDSNFSDLLGIEKWKTDTIGEMAEGSNSTHCPRIIASQYQDVTEMLQGFLSLPYTIVVSREQQAPPKFADIHITVSQRQRQKFKLHPKTQTALENKKEERKRQQRNENLETIRTSISELKSLDANASNVKSKINTSLNKSFPSIQVYDETELRTSRNNTGRKADSAITPDKRQEGVDLRKSLALIGLILVAAIISIVVIVGSPLASGGTGFDIQNLDYNEPVQGEPLEVSVTVVNNGSSGTGNVSLYIDDNESPVDTSTVMINSTKQKTINLTYNGVESPLEILDFSVNTSSDSATDRAVIRPQQRSFEVDIVDVVESVETEPIKLTTEVKNTGNVGVDEQLTLDIDSLGTNSTTISLEPGQSVSKTLSIESESGDTGEYTATATIGESEASTSLAVSSVNRSFEVDIIDAVESVETEPIKLTTEVENTGNVNIEGELVLNIDSLGSNSTTVSLEPDERTNRTLSIETELGDEGEYTATATVGESEASRSLAVVSANSSFEVNIVDSTEPVETEPLEVTMEVENTGNVSAEEQLVLNVDSLDSNSTTVSLGPDERTNTTLSIETGSGDADEYTVTATIGEAMDNDTVSVTNNTSLS